MIIRSFAEHDRESLLALTIDTFGPFYEGSFRPLVGDVVFGIQHGGWRADYRALLAGLHAPQRHSHVAVAEIDGMLAGYVGWSADPARGHGEIVILAVAAAARRQAVGTALCEHAFAALRAEGARMVQIGTGGDGFHAPARALYQRLGCVPVPCTVYFREL